MNKGIVHIRMDTNTLDSTAALAGIKDSAMNQLSGDVLKVGVESNVGRVINLKLQIDGNGASAGSFTNGQAADCRTSKANKAQLMELNNLLDCFRIPVLDDLKDICWQASRVEVIDEVLGNERCLGRRLENDRVACQQS